MLTVPLYSVMIFINIQPICKIAYTQNRAVGYNSDSAIIFVNVSSIEIMRYCLLSLGETLLKKGLPQTPTRKLLIIWVKF